MASKNVSFSPPRGMRDFYPEDMRMRNAIFDAWRAAAGLHAFAPYDACVVETLDLLKRKSGEEIVDQIYAFQDKSGRDLALRPEMTPTLARMVAAKQAALSFPIRWYTIAQCFRYERMTRGRKREHFQWNLDVIGSDSVAAEVEVIATAVRAMSLLGMAPPDFRVLFSNRALLGELLIRMGIAGEHHATAFLALDKRGKIPDEAIADILEQAGLGAEAAAHVLELLGLSSLDQCADILGADSPAMARTRQFLDLAADFGLGDTLDFDLSVIRGLAYYTGIVFEAFDTGRKFRAIFGGGRYDNLLSDVGGAPMTGVGLGFGDVVVAEILSERDKLPESPDGAECIVGYMGIEQQSTAITVATFLRRAGRRTELALAPEKPKAFFSKAAKSGAAKAVYVGPDDVESQTVRIKDLATREETVMPVGEPDAQG